MDLQATLRREGDRFRAALASAAADVRVPTCPDWTAADLAWHLVEVQWFWGTVVVEGHTSDPGAAASADRPDRPDALPGLLTVSALASTRLEEALAAADPGAPLYTWADVDGDAAWVRRRQAHEVLVHRMDAELTAGRTASPPAADLADDGIDELHEHFLTGTPDWGAFRPEGGTVTLHSSDTGRSWGLELGRVVGTPPGSPDALDLPAARAAAPSPEHDAVIDAPAAVLHAWLWGRAGDTAAPDVTGDRSLRAAVRALVADVTG